MAQDAGVICLSPARAQRVQVAAADAAVRHGDFDVGRRERLGLERGEGERAGGRVRNPTLEGVDHFVQGIAKILM